MQQTVPRNHWVCLRPPTQELLNHDAPFNISFLGNWPKTFCQNFYGLFHPSTPQTPHLVKWFCLLQVALQLEWFVIPVTRQNQEKEFGSGPQILGPACCWIWSATMLCECLTSEIWGASIASHCLCCLLLTDQKEQLHCQERMACFGREGSKNLACQSGRCWDPQPGHYGVGCSRQNSWKWIRVRSSLLLKCLQHPCSVTSLFSFMRMFGWT